jgi:protein TonB
MIMQHMNLTPASIAFTVSLTVHAAIVVGVNHQTTAGSFANQIHNLQISLLPVELSQPQITPPAKPRATIVQQKSVAPESVESTETVSDMPVETVADTVTADSELPVSQIEPPKFGADYLNNPPPIYPLAARRRNIEGQVLLRAEIQPDGSCSQVEIKHASPHEMLNQAALDAVKKWHFIPATQGGRNVIAWVEIPIRFKLENQRS